MSNLHPIFQEALAPFFTPVRPAKHEFVYEWDAGISTPLACLLEYEKAEMRTHDNPGQPAAAHLISAYIRDVDIVELLSDDQRAEIEERALISHES